jgi:hypothetical protein
MGLRASANFSDQARRITMAEKDPNAKGYEESSPTPPYGGTAENAPLGATTPESTTAYGSPSEAAKAGESDVQGTLKEAARDVAEYARETKDSLASQTQDVRSTLKDTARDVAGHAREAKDRLATQAQEIAGEAKQHAKTMLDEQKGMAAGTLGSVAEALRQAAQQLHDREQGTIAQYAEQAAGQIDRLSRQLSEKDMGQFIRDAEDLARRQPELFIGGAVAAGFLLARFLKASRRGRSMPPATAYSTHIITTPEGFERTTVPAGSTVGREL